MPPTKAPVPKIDKTTLDRLNAVEFDMKKILVADTDVNSDLYQRSLSKRYLQYAEDWCKLIAAPLVVVEDQDRPGKYFILDGQHTANAAREKFGEDAILWAKVIKPITPEDQAFLFVQLNQERKGLSAQQLHKAKKGSNNESAIKIDDIATSLQLVLGRDNAKPHQEDWTVVSSVNGVYSIADKYGTDVLRRVLTIICEAWDRRTTNFNHQFMVAMARVISQNSNFNDSRMVKVLSEFDNQTAVSARAEDLERAKGSNVKINALQYANTIVHIYNQGGNKSTPDVLESFDQIKEPPKG